MELNEVLPLSAYFVFVFMTVFWGFSVRYKDASIADVVWGLGFVGLAIFLWIIIEDKGILQLVVSVPLVAWGVRLFLHIGTRKVGKPEDWRYVQMREKAGHAFEWISYFKVFLLQGLLMLLIAMPLLISASSTESSVLSHPTVLGGLALWSLGFFFETIADIQLRRFIAKKPKKGQILTSGLWKFSRHPNYFGEAMMWWGLAFVVSTLDFGLLAFISPVVITYLITKISGVDLLEKKYSKNKAYQKYKKTTNSFFPWFPKKV